MKVLLIVPAVLLAGLLVAVVLVMRGCEEIDVMWGDDAW